MRRSAVSVNLVGVVFVAACVVTTVNISKKRRTDTVNCVAAANRNTLCVPDTHFAVGFSKATGRILDRVIYGGKAIRSSYNLSDGSEGKRDVTVLHSFIAEVGCDLFNLNIRCKLGEE